jgi:uncharacterized protein (DUF1330 family)
MPHYFIANIKITNPDIFKKYLDKLDEIFFRYKGEFLAIDESPTLLEGDWAYTKTVLIKFNNKKDFEDWYFSDDYQEILKVRLSASKCDTILVEGVN